MDEGNSTVLAIPRLEPKDQRYVDDVSVVTFSIAVIFSPKTTTRSLWEDSGRLCLRYQLGLEAEGVTSVGGMHGRLPATILNKTCSPCAPRPSPSSSTLSQGLLNAPSAPVTPEQPPPKFQF
ncbi:hypothetical protein ONZ45_g10351 [Pleurotus djamor]|nr:hypothetical protein ONZ45_g10351 [Pleurotus djamor]